MLLITLMLLRIKNMNCRTTRRSRQQPGSRDGSYGL